MAVYVPTSHEALTRILGIGERYHVQGLVSMLLTIPAGNEQFRKIHEGLPANLRFHREDLILIEHAREAVQMGADGRLNDEVARLLFETMQRGLTREVPKNQSWLVDTLMTPDSGFNLTPYYAERLNSVGGPFGQVKSWDRFKNGREGSVYAGPISNGWYDCESHTDKGFMQDVSFSAVLGGGVPVQLVPWYSPSNGVLVVLRIAVKHLTEPFSFGLRDYPKPVCWRDAPGQFSGIEAPFSIQMGYVLHVEAAPHMQSGAARISFCDCMATGLQELEVPISNITMGAVVRRD